MAAPFPHRYSVDLSWQEERSGMLRGGPKPALIGGPPPQFDGSARWWSPEELLLGAVNLCTMTTFLSYAARHQLRIAGYSSRASGILDKVPNGIEFTRISLNIDLRVAPEDRQRAEQLAAKAKKHCIISNSLRVAPELTVRINDDSALPAPD